MSVGKRNNYPIGCKVEEPGQRVSGETRLTLFAIGQYGRPGLFETFDRISKRLAVGTIQIFGSDAAGFKRLDRLNQLWRAGNAANGFGRDSHPRSVTTQVVGIFHQKVDLFARSLKSGLHGESTYSKVNGQLPFLIRQLAVYCVRGRLR